MTITWLVSIAMFTSFAVIVSIATYTSPAYSKLWYMVLVYMALSSAGVRMCEPTRLYNLLAQSSSNRQLPAVAVEDGFLLLLDARRKDQYEQSHCLLAKHIEMEQSDGETDYKILHVPYGADLTTTIHCVVYDSNTVSPVENTPAVQIANRIAQEGSRNTVEILSGGYGRFSAEYPFLRTQKRMYTQLELEKLPRYPNEILPLFLYLGDSSHAYNAALIYDMKINAVVNMAANSLPPCFPDTVRELSIGIEDCPESNILEKLIEICHFLEERQKRSERVLVYSQCGISRSAVAVTAYLMYTKKWTMKAAVDHVRECRPQVCMQQCFINQLRQWEEQLTEEATP